MNVIFNNDDRANLEVQCSSEKKDQLLRSIFYSGKLLSTTLKEGEKYEKMRFIHQIMFANFPISRMTISSYIISG